MSRGDFTAELRAALDLFVAPAPREAFADRIVAASANSAGRPQSRDRRGRWMLVRRAVIGTVAAGMVSAAAVASGLLGSAGIRVPVLTAMLAPASQSVVEPHRRAVRAALAVKPHVVATRAERPELSDPGSIAPPPAIRPTLGTRIARRAERRAFIASHPELRPAIRQPFRGERQFVRTHPEVRNLRRLPLAERRAFLAERPELQAAVRAHRAERRAFLAANPEIAALFRARAGPRKAAPKPDPASAGETRAPR